jgi:predicted DNA-binding protein (MmcQ/YjbR family)
MQWDALLDYCLAKPGAWPDEPWGDGVVAKVGQKIFAFLRSVGPGGEALGVGVKCGASREAADEWLLRFPGDAAVMPYIGRSGWNSLSIGRAIPDDEILEAIDASYAMVVSKLPKKDRPASLSADRVKPGPESAHALSLLAGRHRRPAAGRGQRTGRCRRIRVPATMKAARKISMPMMSR